MNKRLYRSSTNRVLCGVCGGIGEYFDIDPVFVRLVFIFLLIITGFLPGILFYLIACIIVPLKK